jgi:rubrerythrin
MKSQFIKGTLTERNLVNAYISESAAYSRYTYYAQQADKENYFPIGKAFREAADNELHHGKVFFKLLEGGVVDCQLAIDAGTISDTASNLAIAAQEELQEGYEQYISAAKTADEEGFADIAKVFRAIADVELHHRQIFLQYLEEVNGGTVWQRIAPTKWRCLVCGYIYEGTEPPARCPGCNHPREHFEQCR